MEAKIRELRIEIDRMINSTGMINPSREVFLCHTQLQRGKAWLGEVLKELGAKNPYPASSDPTKVVIEPQAEHCTEAIWNGPDMLEHTQTAHVKFFRKVIAEYLEKIDKLIEGIYNGDYGDLSENQQLFWVLGLSESAMIEAKHWLGWELDRIRKQKIYEESEKNGTAGCCAGRMVLPL